MPAGIMPAGDLAAARGWAELEERGLASWSIAVPSSGDGEVNEDCSPRIEQLGDVGSPGVVPFRRLG